MNEIGSSYKSPDSDQRMVQIQIRNFRSIRESTIELRRGLNVLIGPNGSGKTNLLAALMFLRDVLTSGVALAMGKAGGPPHNFYRGSREMGFSVSGYYGHVRLRRRKLPVSFSWEFSVAQRGTDRISELSRQSFRLFAYKGSHAVELLYVGVRRPVKGKASYRTRLMKEDDLSLGLFLQPYGRRPSGPKAKIFDDVRRSLRELARAARSRVNVSLLPGLQSILPRISAVVRQLTLLDEYNIHPDAARQSTDQTPQAMMEPDGSGLSEVVNALLNRDWHRIGVSRSYPHLHYPSIFEFGRGYTHHVLFSEREELFYRYGGRRGRHPFVGAIENITEHLAAAVNSVDSLSTRIDPTNGRRFVVFHSGQNEFLPDEVSDGTIKWLCLLVSIFVPSSRTYLLEEPENFMHPWMQQRLVQIMREESGKKNLTFVVSSHSATILNSTKPDEIVLVNYKGGSSRVSRVENLDELNRFLNESQFGLGDLWISGDLGAVPGGE